ncbi:unnamed protein product, partial [Symbiodinium pilosum]
VCMKVLLEAQAEPNCCDRLCNTPLGEAAKCGALDVVQLLLERRGQVNMCNYRAETPVLLAMQRNHIEVVRLLCRHRADANRGKGLSQLLATKVDRLESLCLLLELRTDVNARNEAGDTALLSAVKGNRMAALSLLLSERHVDVNAHDPRGDTPLLQAIRS